MPNKQKASPGSFPCQPMQHIPGQDLPPARHGVGAAGNPTGAYADGRQSLHFHLKEVRRVLAEHFQGRTLLRAEITQGLQIDDATPRCRVDWVASAGNRRTSGPAHDGPPASRSGREQEPAGNCHPERRLAEAPQATRWSPRWLQAVSAVLAVQNPWLKIPQSTIAIEIKRAWRMVTTAVPETIHPIRGRVSADTRFGPCPAL